MWGRVGQVGGGGNVTPGSLRSPGAGSCDARFTGADRVARRSRRRGGVARVACSCISVTVSAP